MNQTGEVEESAEDNINTGMNEPQEIERPTTEDGVKLAIKNCVSVGEGGSTKTFSPPRIGPVIVEEEVQMWYFAEYITQLPPVQEPVDRDYMWQCLLGAASGFFCRYEDGDGEVTDIDRIKTAIHLKSKCKLTYAQAEFWTGVPRSTACDHVKGRVGKIGRGRNKLLTDEQERRMADEMRRRNIKCARPSTSNELPTEGTAAKKQLMKVTHKVAVDLQIEPLISDEKTVGRKWFDNFVRRHELY
ncbi:hypothetical protein U1Q18_050682 [Sarracenia purpurea var. burkii]